MNSDIQQLFDLSGKTAVVIGGTGELCGAMAEGLAGAGALVILVGRSEAKAKARMDAIAKAGGSSVFVAADVSTKAALQGLLDTVVAQYGKVDILINGAGINSPTPFLDVPEEELDRIMNVNFKATYLACQIFGAHMVSNGSGSIINLGSASGKVLTPERVTQIMGHTPMKRFGNSRELIGATLLLASDKAGSFITGHELVVDGGFNSMTI